MKVTTFALQKGGTGKTSSAVSVSVELANKGFKTLVIDADPQGNATTWIGIDNITYELADALQKKCSLVDCIVPTSIQNLYFAPTASVGGSLKLYSKTLANGSPFAIKHLLKTIKDDYDFIIIDTSPAFGALEESCLLASDEAITVLKLDEFSKDGLISFLNNINDMKDRYDTEKPKMNKIILNQRDLRLSVQNGILDEITSATKSKIFIIPTDQVFSKAQSIHYPVQALDCAKKETLRVISEIASSLVD